MTGAKAKAKHVRQQAIPALFEWVIAAASVLLLLGILGYLGYEAVAARHGLPELAVELVEVVPQDEAFLVRITVHNRGERTAAQVGIEGVLATTSEQTSSLTLDYVPARSSQSGALLFADDPRGTDLSLRVTGFADP